MEDLLKSKQKILKQIVDKSLKELDEFKQNVNR